MSTGAAVGVSALGATLTATVNPHGRRARVWFQFGPSRSYGARVPALAVSSSARAVRVSEAVSRLTPLSVYHYRVAASTCNGCASGTRYGADATFTVSGYQNPVYPDSAPDPYVLDNGGTHSDYWAITTGNLFPILHSTDLLHWTDVGPAMIGLPTWVVQTGNWHPWAPSVVRVAEACPDTSSSSCYVMYYVGLNAEFRTNCVAVATATTPGGPYADQGPLNNGTLDASGRPVGCGDNSGHGVIDPSPFTDPNTGESYLYVSEDFACPPASSSCTSVDSRLQPTISVIPLAGDRLHASGPRTPLFSGAAGTWEASGVLAPTVEGPAVTLHNGTYYLFYSAGNWRSTYAMGYATGPSPTGPFTRASSNPWLPQTATVLSPGGGDVPVIGPHGGLWLVYHGRSSSYANSRALRIDPFAWVASATGPDRPVVGGPSSTPQGGLP